MGQSIHDLSGKAMFWDRIEHVHLDCDLDLEVTPSKARVYVGEMGDPDDSGEAVFQRPEVVSALGIIAQMIKARKAHLAAKEAGATDTAVPPFRFPDPIQDPCPVCQHRGWLYDNDDNARRCPMCHGRGVVSRW